MKEIDPIDRLRDEVDRHGSFRLAAKVLGFDHGFLCNVLNGSRKVSPRLLKRLGLKRIVVADKGAA